MIGPMYLCLQEPKGKMGDTVKKNLFEPTNVVITCSTSGKLTSSLVLYWRDHCLAPSIDHNSLLLSDSWSAQNDNKIYSDLKSIGKDVKRIMIPQHTTPDIQPLDKFFNRQMKFFIKKLYNRVALDEMEVDLWQRNNIIKLISLVHNQLSAPVFRQMIRYSWFASGYTQQNPSLFSNVSETCFPSLSCYETCTHHKCTETSFITCAVCAKKLCFEHFYVDYHFHS